MAEQEARGQAIDLRLVLKALRRHRALVAVAATVGAIVGAVVATLNPAPYVSTSVVLFASPPPGGSQLTLDEATYVELASSKQVAQQAIAATDADLTVDELAAAVTVATPSAALLEIDVAHADSSTAAGLSAALADSFVGYLERLRQPLTGQAEADLEDEVERLEAQAAQVDEELAAARVRLAQPADEAQRVREAQLVASLTAERSDLAVKLATLQEQLARGTSSEGFALGVNARVIDRGEDPVRPSQALRGALGGVIGAALGFAFAAVIALRRTRRDRSLRSAWAVAGIVGAPILVGLQAHPQRTPEGWQSAIGTFSPTPSGVWAVRRLLRRLASQNPSTRTLVMIALSGDLSGQSMAPLVAAAASSLGLQTSLTAVGDPTAAPNLWAGLRLARLRGVPRENLTVTREPSDTDIDLSVLVAVIDPNTATLAEVPSAAAVVLCLSPGAATTEDISRLLLALDAVDRSVAGVMLANPDEWDDAEASWSYPVVDDDAHPRDVIQLSSTTRLRGRQGGGTS